MLASARAFFENMIDYAGMFPPAKLPMAEALQNYTRYAAGPGSWMLGRFVCRTGLLGELESLVKAQGAANAVPVIALGEALSDAGEFTEKLRVDFEQIEAFRQDRAIVVDTLETPAPPSLSADDVAYLASRLNAAQRGVVRQRAFLELPLSYGWSRDVYHLSFLLAGACDPEARQTIGLKIRCGGTTIPTVEQIAHFIDQCRETRLLWKATAGLHHPLRHRAGSGEMTPGARLQHAAGHRGTTGEMAHGFLNVFGAGILAHVHKLNVDQLAEVLREESAAAFRFTDDGFAWRDWNCTVDQIREARQWIPSFGSCSFVEPCEDLRAMGLID